MSKLKEIPIQSTIAWSPLLDQPDLIVAGTVSGTIGADFDTSSQLEIYSLDIKNESNQMSLKGKITANNRFNDIAWGKSNTFSHGIIAGAMDNSIISFWDPSKILKGEESSLISLGQRHTGSVNSIHFNQLKSNLIASGGSNSEIFVWDLENPTSPSSYAPDVNSQGLEISCVNWNNVYQHILAASTYSGNIIIWDLKANRQLINFTDKSRRSRYKSIVWDPTVSTHLVAASEDDDYPVIQYWDLRNFQSPIKTLDAHTKGVWGLSWSSFDKSLLLSTGKDGKTFCWNIEKGEVLCEIGTQNNNTASNLGGLNLNNSSNAIMMAQQSNAWNFDVQWSPRIPGLLSSCSFSNNVNIYSLQDVNGKSQPASVNSLGVTEPAKKAVLKHTPRWLQRPVGASFGFGGKLVCFSKFKPTPQTPGSPVQPQKPQFKVNIVKISTDEELQTRSQVLEQSIQSGNYEQYCQDKIDSSTSDDEKSIWGFLKLLFSKNERQMILNYLGYDIEYIKTELQKFLTTLPEVQTSSLNSSDEKEEDNKSSDEEQKDDKEKTGNLFLNSNGDDFNISPSSSLTISSSPIQFPGSGNEQMITKALMIGDSQLAIECCLRLGRLSDALILAHAAGPEFWKSTQDKYFEIVKSPFAKVVSCIVKKDFEALVKSCDLSDWKATLSVLCTYATTTILRELSGILGDRLDKEANDTKSATLCYICAGDIDKTVNIWTRSRKATEDINVDSASSSLDLQSFIEKVVIFRNSSSTTSQLPLNDVLTLKYSKYAELLASQGNLQSSLRYLSLLPNNPTSAVLLDRVYHATNQRGNIPPFPFQSVQVGKGPIQQNNTNMNMLNNNMNSMNINRGGFNQPPTPVPIQNTFKQPPVPVQNFQVSTPSNTGFNQPPVNNMYNQPPPSNTGFNQPPVGNMYNQPPPSNTGFNQPPPSNTGFNQPPPSNTGFNQPPPSNTGFNQPPPSNTGFNQPPPSNTGFNQPPPSNTGFNQPPPSNTGFNQPPVGNMYQPPPSNTGFNQPPPSNTGFKQPPMMSTLPINQNQSPVVSNEPPPMMTSFVPKTSTETSPKTDGIYQPPPKPNVHNSTSIPGTPTLGNEGNANPQEVIEQIKTIVDNIQSDPRANKQVVDEIHKKISTGLVNRISNSEISSNGITALQVVIKSIQEGDYKSANEKYILLTTSYWNDIGSQSMTGLKRIIEFGLRK